MSVFTTTKPISNRNKPLRHKDKMTICSHIQKFKSWLIMAIRSADIQVDSINVNPEDVIVHHATLLSRSPPFRPLHPKLVNALTIFNTPEFDDLFGIPRRMAFEHSIGHSLSSRRFFICERHCSSSGGNINCDIFTIQSSRRLEDQQDHTIPYDKRAK